MSPWYFNPRAPRGARLILLVNPQDYYQFQSTRPSRGATGCKLRQVLTDEISIHAPLAGRDYL